MSIGTRLRHLREKKGLSRKEAAEVFNMPYTTYTNYETDAREPGSHALVQFASAYGVTVDYILGRCPDTDNFDQKKFETTLDQKSDAAYFRFSAKAKEQGIPPEDLELALDFIRRAKESSRQVREQENGNK